MDEYTRGAQEATAVIADKWAERCAKAEARVAQIERLYLQQESEFKAERERWREELEHQKPLERATGYIQAHYDLGERDIIVKRRIFDDYESGVVAVLRFMGTTMVFDKDLKKGLAFRDAIVRPSED